jgi:hypothetical protein
VIEKAVQASGLSKEKVMTGAAVPGRPVHQCSRCTEVTQVKQFLVMKVVSGLNQMAGMMALPGLYTLEAAQEFVKEALESEPGSNYLIQEVGTA